jgi:hypothetical protein
MKLQKVRRLGYLVPGPVRSLTSFFSVPKGMDDIRMVYDGMKSGLNEAMWAPWFSLPMVEAHLRFVDEFRKYRYRRHVSKFCTAQRCVCSGRG